MPRYIEIGVARTVLTPAIQFNDHMFIIHFFIYLSHSIAKFVNKTTSFLLVIVVSFMMEGVRN